MNYTSPDLLVQKNPKSIFTESIKTIRTNLAFSTIDKKTKVILFTSTDVGDGKSFICANLAVAYAQEGKRVLIVDCDLRRGRQHAIFGVENSNIYGYTNLILNYHENMKMNNYILKTTIKNIELLPVGVFPPNPVELLGSSNNAELMEIFRNRYDIVILDCPPVIGLSDTILMSRYSDANVLVVSNKKTKAESIERTKKIFAQANAKITGVIFNRANVEHNSYYGYYSAGR